MDHPKRKATSPINLADISEENLLNCRICDLPLRIAGTWLEDCVRILYDELETRGIQKFRPQCYLADEWLTPDGEPVIGIPFYLADPVLMKLEGKMMLEVEGGTKEWCMKLLRHETGHAINYAYQLHKRRKWKNIFGSFSVDYPDTYRFKPYSKKYVKHLGEHYAQYHPDEDFTETFAVWLTPEQDWQTRYKGWKALKKLQYIDELMQEIKEKEPVIKKGKKYWNLSSLKRTLKNQYKKKRHFWAEEFPDFHDINLGKIFEERSEENKNLPLAVDVIRKYQTVLLKDISRWTGERKHIVNDILKKITRRCRVLKLVSSQDEAIILTKISTYLTTLVMNYKYTGWFRGKI